MAVCSQPAQKRISFPCLTLVAAMSVASAGLLPAAAAAQEADYLVLATNKTSTMEKELNASAEKGFRYGGVMGGETAFGGNEVVVVMWKDSAETEGRYSYRLLATSKTSTMQKEIQQAGEAGYEYRGQTVFESMFGGKEVVVILERDKNAERKEYEYKLLATSKTSTMQKELSQAGAQGYGFVGLTVGETAMGGQELVVITRRTTRK